MHPTREIPARGGKAAQGRARRTGRPSSDANCVKGGTDNNSRLKGANSKGSRARKVADADGHARGGTAASGGVRERGSGQHHGGAAQPDLYESVTQRIIAEMEAGRVPWVQPWGVAGAVSPGLPRNALTGRAYSGVNVLILWGAVIDGAFPSQAWLTFRQALQAGGSVRKGERGTTVVYADRFIPEAEKTRARETGDSAKTVAFLKRFTVFNASQCDGLREGVGVDAPPLPPREVVPVAEKLIAASGVDFRIGGGRAFYVPSHDFVQVPPQPAFFAPVDYYRTCLHELTHATGHKSRLDRSQISSFGTKDYAREELIAEMGSAFLCAALGIVPTVRHADYLSVWLDVLREDKRTIFRAASAASKAADWLLARQHDALADPPERQAA